MVVWGGLISLIALSSPAVAGDSQSRPLLPPNVARPVAGTMVVSAPAVLAPSPTPRKHVNNPYDRDIDLTVPVERGGKPLGEVAVRVTRDDEVLVAGADFTKLVDPLLSLTGRAKLAGIVGTAPYFRLDDLPAANGLAVRYDPNGLTLEITSIDPSAAALESLFRRGTDDLTPPDIAPAHVSAFLNTSIVENRIWSGFNRGLQKPSFYFNGAMRVAGIVLEGDGKLAQRDTFLKSSNYQLDRNFVRFVYDQPAAFRRVFLGDLTPEIRGQQGYVQMGGIGVSRQRRRFDQFRSAILQGNRQLVLQKEATVDVYRNGALYQQFHLPSGRYDLASLPLTTGSNDVRIEVRDASGSIQSLNYQSYLDPIDLEPGDYEYGAYLGKTGVRVGQSPVYNGDVGFTGFFRKSFLDRPAIGIGLQASRHVQQLTGQTQFILLGGSRLIVEGGFSHASNGGGYTAGVAFDKLISRSDLADSFSVQATYQSRRFAGLGYDLPDNSSAWSLTALYARGLTRDITLLVGGSLLKERNNGGNSYRLFANTSYRLSDKWRIQGGVDYAKFGSSRFARSGPGFTVSLVYQPNFRNRAELRHDSRIRSSGASFVHASSGYIGGVGFGAIAGRDEGTVNAQAFVDYIANRFDASLAHSSFGEGFAHLTDRQVTSARLSSSIVFADGAFGIGRRVSDSFALLYPHQTLKGHAVVAGQSLAENDYLSKSGALGGAVNGFLTSYVTQSVQYDVENPPVGYDVGSGVLRVKPAYHSGYKVRIGTDAFVSAVGTILSPSGTPISLATGMIVSLDRQESAKSFFTNTVGRFAIQNLRLGERYRIELAGNGGSYEFVVPKNNDGLVDLKFIRVEP